MSESRYGARIEERIARARRRGAQAMTLVALLSLVLTIFLIYVLTTAVRLADREAIRAGWLGLAIIVVANGLSLLLYRSQAKVLDTAMTDLAEIIDGAGEPASGSGEDATD